MFIKILNLIIVIDLSYLELYNIYFMYSIYIIIIQKLFQK